MDNMSDESNVTPNPKMFAALNLMQRVAPPLIYGRVPLWRAPVRIDPARVHIPSWNWSAGHREIPKGERPVTLDCNGAFMAALGSVLISHSELRHTGPLDAFALPPRQVRPGYYQITAFHWPLDATIVSPLGNHQQFKPGAHIWVAGPTLVLLLELLNEGAIPELEIHDSWTSNRVCDFREWNVRLKSVRNALLDNREKAVTPEEKHEAEERYKAFKEGYGAAFAMMLTGRNCGVHRPDWSHAVYAQHAATSWRKAWRFSVGAPLLAMGDTDTMTVLERDLRKAVQSVKAPVKLDPSGRRLGHYKPVKDAPAPKPAATPDYVMSDTFRDVM